MVEQITEQTDAHGNLLKVNIYPKKSVYITAPKTH